MLCLGFPAHSRLRLGCLFVEEMEKNQGIQVISRAAGILRALADEADGQSLGQIAKRVELPRSTVQRIVNALASEGLVTAGRGAGAIRLGPEIQVLADAGRVDMAESLKPVMKGISEETGETVDLAVLDGIHMVFIDQVVGSQRLRTVSNIGERFPLVSTANGKAALATLTEAQAARLVADEVERTESRRTVAELLDEIAGIRDGAIASDLDEHTDGISALGFALKDRSGEVYAISVPVPSSRFPKVKDRLDKVLTKWRQGVTV